MSVPSQFYDQDALGKLAVNLFNGWGYNFYRVENQLRADDQVIRAKVGFLLGSARKSVEIAEKNYRRKFLPPPSREKPRPDPDAMANAQEIERLSKSIGALVALISSQPVPENDRMTQRYRLEAPTLQNLINSDRLLTGQAEQLRLLLDGKDGPALLEDMSTLQEGIGAISETLRHRQLILFPAI